MRKTWIPATEAIVQTAIHQASKQCVLGLEDCLKERAHWREAERVLEALATAGMLLPHGTTSREEWLVSGEPGDPYPPYSFTWALETNAQDFINLINDSDRVPWKRPPTLSRRLIHTEPYTEVS